MYDHKRNTEILEQCEVNDVVKWSKQRRHDWNTHVDRMDNTRLAKICRDNIPRGTRPVGRPKKRWTESQFSSSNYEPTKQGQQG